MPAWLRRLDLNQRSPAYEAGEMPLLYRAISEYNGFPVSRNPQCRARLLREIHASRSSIQTFTQNESDFQSSSRTHPSRFQYPLHLFVISTFTMEHPLSLNLRCRCARLQGRHCVTALADFRFWVVTTFDRDQDFSRYESSRLW